MRCACALLLVSCLFKAMPAMAWGNKGHQVVTIAATGLMETPASGFFRANKDALATLSNVPDVVWKSTSPNRAEAPYHFFQWDFYKNTALAGSMGQSLFSTALRQIGNDQVKTNGSSIWRAGQVYQRLVAAMQAGDQKTALQMAGVLSHYVGDLSQPMHDTSDYDGQSIGRRGIHSYYETQLLDADDRAVLSDRVVATAGPNRQNMNHMDAPGGGNARAMVLKEGQAAFERLAAVLGGFSANGQDDTFLHNNAVERMSEGALMVARLWDMAVTEAGNVKWAATALGDISAPTWFELTDH